MAASTKKEIHVYAHWRGLQEPSLMGMLSASSAKGRESFSFEYADEWLKSGFSQMIDPDLQLYSGAYYPRDDKPNFGVFLEYCLGSSSWKSNCIFALNIILWRFLPLKKQCILLII